MCGIVGIWGSGTLDEGVLDSMVHRGPDGRGVFRGPGVSLGHVRLSIIDLSERGGQPMQSEDGHYVIVYNGEVYNYRELRAELEERGVSFVSDSDTEVVLQAYRQWGKECVRRFRGMFAFAIWDEGRQELFLARDRCGERPLLYAKCGEQIVFASEMKALRRLLGKRPALDPAAVDMFLHYQYVPEPWTLLQGVHKLPAGHTMTLTREGQEPEPEEYWDIVTAEDSYAGPEVAEGDILTAIRDTLEESVKLCLRADVPVGVALSGGIDSGVIAALAQRHSAAPLHAFSVGYPGRPAYDEREQAKRLAQDLGMIFHEVEIPVADFVQDFPSLVQILDEPVADIAAFGHLAVPKAAHALGLKVLLSGIGGDELFWGYDWTRQAVELNMAMSQKPFSPWMLALFRQKWLRPLPRSLARKAWLPAKMRHRSGLLFSALEKKPAHYPYFMSLSPDFRNARKALLVVAGRVLRDLPEDTAFWPQAMPLSAKSLDDTPSAIMSLLFHTWLTSNCLTQGDRLSMSVSVESRLPFLDAELMGLVMTLRRKSPDHGLGQKAWLRAALKGVLSDEVLARPKAGFTPPVKEWAGGVVKAYGNCLLGGELCRAGLVEQAAIAAWLKNQQNLKWHEVFLLYKLIMLEMWYTNCMA